MKKLLCLVLAVLTAVSLSACANTGTAGESGNTQPTEPNVVTPGESQKPFEQIVVVDNENCAIIITDCKKDAMWGNTLNVQVENKSQDETYMFDLESVAINGVQTTPLFIVEVAAGKKANEEIYFVDSYLEENGVNTFTDIELKFRVYETNNWEQGNLVEQTVHVYPQGKAAASTFTREAKPTDTVIMDNEYVTVVVTGYKNDSIFGYVAELYLVNKSDKELMISTAGASVNDFMMDPYFAVALQPGKSTFSFMNWFADLLEENGITEVETIEFGLVVSDNEDWLAEDYAKEVITLKP